MRTAVEGVVIACMFVAIYINWTDFPKQPHNTQGHLVKLGVEQ